MCYYCIACSGFNDNADLVARGLHPREVVVPPETPTPLLLGSSVLDTLHSVRGLGIDVEGVLEIVPLKCFRTPVPSCGTVLAVAHDLTSICYNRSETGPCNFTFSFTKLCNTCLGKPTVLDFNSIPAVHRISLCDTFPTNILSTAQQQPVCTVHCNVCMANVGWAYYTEDADGERNVHTFVVRRKALV